jgi:hypothetical protein
MEEDVPPPRHIPNELRLFGPVGEETEAVQLAKIAAYVDIEKARIAADVEKAKLDPVAAADAEKARLEITRLEIWTKMSAEDQDKYMQMSRGKRVSRDSKLSATVVLYILDCFLGFSSVFFLLVFSCHGFPFRLRRSLRLFSSYPRLLFKGRQRRATGRPRKTAGHLPGKVWLQLPQGFTWPLVWPSLQSLQGALEGANACVPSTNMRTSVPTAVTAVCSMPAADAASGGEIALTQMHVNQASAPARR